MIRPRRLGSLLLGALMVAAAPVTAHAQSAAPHADKRADAETQFRHGVLLFKDNDYAGALVEFRRAYELAPHFRVLYNIGQTYYQLQRYADALTAFEAYLAQGGAQVPPARRTAIEGDIRLLQARVAQLDIQVNVAGAEIRVDDEVVATSPAKGPILVSIGHRKITVASAGRVPLERFLDVASGDRLKLSFDFRDEPAPAGAVASAAPSPSSAPPASPASAARAADAEPAPSSSHAGTWVAWGATLVLAAGTAGTGLLTLSARSELTQQLNTFPGNAAQIDHERSRARTLGAVTDVLLGTTAVSAAIAIYLTLPASRPTREPHVAFGLGLGTLQIRGTY